LDNLLPHPPKDVANPLATILSVAMMLRYSLNQSNLAEKIEAAVTTVLDQGYRTPDIASVGNSVHQSFFAQKANSICPIKLWF
jgi:isocitrate/isopropylmalate dehydrogenase